MNVAFDSQPPPDLGRVLLDLTFPGTEAEKGRAIGDILAALASNGPIPGPERFRIQLCLDEAIQNAIRHGNGGDPSKVVDVRVSAIEDEQRILVRDQGPGFDPARVPDPREGEGLERESGRGLFILLEYMDGVRYYDGGRTLVLVRKRKAERVDA